MQSSICGYAKADLSNLTNLDLIHTKWHDTVKRMISEQVIPRGYSDEFEVEYMKKDGTIFPASVRLWNIKDKEGKSVGRWGIVRDITDRKKSDELIRRAEQRYRSLFEEAPVMYVVSRNQEDVPIVADCNEMFLHSLGYTRFEVLGRSLADFYTPDSTSQLFEDNGYKKALQGHFDAQERELIARDGHVIKTLLRAVPEIDSTGKVTGTRGMFVDITERKHAEEALKASEAKYSTLVEKGNDGIIIIQDAVLKFVNSMIIEITGFSLEETLGKQFINFVSPKYKDLVIERYKRRLSGEIVPKRYEIEIISKDSRNIPVEINASVIEYEGHPADMAIIRDITERKQTEEALAAEKERLMVTLRSIGDGVIATDIDGNVILMNKVAERLTGWSHEEAIGKPLNTIFHVIDETTKTPCENPVEKMLNTEGVDGCTKETILVSKEGIERIVANSGAPIKDKTNNNIGVVLGFRDITESRKMKEERQKFEKLESLALLAGGIAHDFNNFLTAILSNITLAKLYADFGDKVSERLTEIEKASMRAQDLTKQLLTFSKGGAPIRKSASIIDLLEDTARFALSGSITQCEFSTAEDLWHVDVDEGQISQVIQNLIINADQAMPDGGLIEVHAENTIIGAEEELSLQAGKYVKITIKDQGIGIPKENLLKIFDPYFTTKETGSGLGLATTFSIIKKHEGYITVESEVGVGTTFCIYLHASEKQTLMKKEAAKGPITGDGKILVMDDEEVIREAIGEILTLLGYQVEFAKNGEEAVELYKEAKDSTKPFDVVIMDLNIRGGMGGKETIKNLLEIDPKVKALVSSGNSNDPVMVDFEKHGFSGVANKPYNIEELSRTLDTLIGWV